MTHTDRSGSPIIPTIRYRDASAAVEWLRDAFGFEVHLAVPGDNGQIRHAQLTFGKGMVMLGSARDNDVRHIQSPSESSESQGSQSPYIVVADVDAHCAHARSSGATIVSEPIDQDYGGRFYSCRDPEGNLWNFGTYDPWLQR